MKVKKLNFHILDASGNVEDVEDQPALLSPELSRKVDESNAITSEKMRDLQDVADDTNVLLPTQWNRIIKREYQETEGEQALLPPFKTKKS